METITKIQLTRYATAWFALFFLFACEESKEGDKRELRAMQIHGGAVTHVAFSSDGRYLASASLDNTIRLLDVEDYHKKYQIDEAALQMPLELKHSPIVGWGNGFSSVVFAPNSSTLVSGSQYPISGGTVQFWDVDAGDQLGAVDGLGPWITALAFAPSGETLLVGSGDSLSNGQVDLLSIQSHETIASFGASFGGVEDLAISPGGDLVAVAAGDGTLKIWTWEGALYADLTAEDHRPYAVDFSKDGLFLVSAGDDSGNFLSGYVGVIRVWDLLASELSHSLDLGTGPIRTMKYSPDGSLLAAAGDGLLIHLVDPLNMVLVDTMRGHTATVNTLAFSSNGQLLASGSNDNYLRLWFVSDLVGQTCNDGMDNDRDGWIDGKDPDCLDGVRETGYGFAQCNDREDNDGDSQRDAADPQCLDGFDDVESAPIEVDGGLLDAGLDAGLDGGST